MRIIICWIAAFLTIQRTSAAQVADLVVLNARAWTGDSASPWATTFAVRAGRFVAVGEVARSVALRGPSTRVIDAGGRFVSPGFIDNHTHFEQAGALLLGANLLDVSDEATLVKRVREARDRLPAGAWLVGGDWGAYEAWARNSGGGRRAGDSSAFRPHRGMLDSLTNSTPVLLSKWDRSAYLANGRALAIAGASCDWEGVECDNARPTGRVSAAAAARIRSVMPPKSLDQRLSESRAALAQLRELGVTGIHDITPPQQLAVYLELKRRGELTTRVNARPTLDKWRELRAVGIGQGFGDDWLRIGGLKGFTDGIMGNSSARFYEPYLTTGVRGSWRDSTNTGAQRGPGSGMEPAGNMERNLLGADSAGFWPMVHAIGDHAVDTVLTIYERVLTINGKKDRRPRVIHAQVLRNAAVAGRMARLGVTAEVQPYHAIDDMRWMEERIGPRSRWAYAFRTLRDSGVRLSFGSDWPGTNASWYTANPLQGMYAAVTRQTIDGTPTGGWFPEERIDVESALRAYTVNNAWASGQEKDLGQIAVGKLADFVILERDPFKIPATELKDVRVAMTVIGGRTVYERSGWRTRSGDVP
jgi:predicted amidohydrolase YtcJ